LRYASHVGSGFTDKTLAQTQARLEAIETKKLPFSEKPPLNGPTVWVEPELVAEVKFQDWTKDGYLRAPVFLRLRDDIEPKEVRRSHPETKTISSGSQIDEVVQQLDNSKAGLTLEVGKHQIRLTHLDRVYWPADPALK